MALSTSLGIGSLGNVVVLPFEWAADRRLHYYLPRFNGLRETTTGSSEPMSQFRFRETLSSPLQVIARGGGHLTLLFHPFLEEQEGRFLTAPRAVAQSASLRSRGKRYRRRFPE
jgi:hypothetical protein